METIRDNAAYPPDRLNEDWRYGRPHVHAQKLLSLLEGGACNAGDISLDATGGIGDIALGGAGEQAAEFASIGSGYLVRKALEKCSERVALSLVESTPAESPFTLRLHAHGLYVPCVSITIGAGVRAHIVEEHVHSGESALICLRRYTLLPGASLALELREIGSGCSRAMNVTCLSCLGDSRLRQITTHRDHAWAREETTVTLSAQDGAAPEALLLSANHLSGKQWLDQRTRQLHYSPGGKSSLLYKNVVDGDATAIFGGNIRVEPGAHETDAYLSNLNMMLSEDATVHSLPGLEILADRVRCSHGSATAPMDAEQLFYLLSRGIEDAAARRMLAEGFLADVWEKARIDH